MLEPVFSDIGPAGALKICVLSDEIFYPWTPAPYLQNYHWGLFMLSRLNSVRTVQELVKRDYDIFINVCDANPTEPRPGLEVILALEEAGVAFTGADSAFYDPSREDMKRVCQLYGLNFPLGIQVGHEEEIDRVAASLPFPMIVKIPNSYGSEGIEPASRVETPTALYTQVRKVMAKYSNALVEQFIEGREFTVLVVENPDDQYSPKAYRPVEFIFPPGETFKHFNLKWYNWEKIQTKSCDDPFLSERLMEAGRKLFVGLNGVSFGRCDMRMDSSGDIYILEINPNCAILYTPPEQNSADFMLMNDPEGHHGFLERIFRAALARRDRLQPNWFVRYNPKRGYGLYARRKITEGETILRHEKRPHTLVSLEHVRKHWPQEQQQLFACRSYPLTDDVWVVPSDNPAEWTPINHACEPNAWWQGLDIIARQPISNGEEITLDYATFHNEQMPEFACACGTPSCRKIIRGTDYLLPFVERYGEHVTGFVKQKRSAV